MKVWVGVTDRSWFEHLAALKPDEVNFWRPSGPGEFHVLQPGEPFLFKLKSPNNFVVGGGYFVRYSRLPLSLAWAAFEQKNGASSLDQLRKSIRQYRHDDDALDPVIGCNVLAEPFFLPRSEWVPSPPSWSPNIVTGKSYDAEAAEGRALWDAVSIAAKFTHRANEPEADASYAQRFGKEFLTRGRLGQGAFRVLVTDAYQRRCAITGEKTLPVLEAAHIKPYAEQGPHRVDNGLLLRSDLHKLFDLGYITVTPKLHVEVSSRLREEWQNGREYYAHHGKKLQIQPGDAAFSPGREFLAWHNERFKA
jgi:putative restriction endonuclease